MSIGNRNQILLKLINFEDSIESISSELRTLRWDTDDDVVIVLTIQMLETILLECIDGKKSISDLEIWANLIECREDIEFEEVYIDKIKTIIHSLANPELNGSVNIDFIKHLLND